MITASKNKTKKQKQKTDKTKRGAPLLGLAKSIYYLFLIAIEIMAISIRTNEQIEGIKIGEDETKYLLYADDMTATLANISSVEKVYKPSITLRNVLV